MRTLKTGTWTDRGGFTLTEVAVVLVIIGLFASFTIPRLSEIGELKLNRSASHLARTITYLYSEAAAHHRVVRLYIDLDSGKYYAAAMGKSGEFEKTSFPLFNSGTLSAGIEVKRFVTLFGGSFGGKSAYMHFMPEGFAEKTVIVLKDQSGRLLTLVVDPLTGRVKVESGELNIDYGAAAA